MHFGQRPIGLTIEKIRTEIQYITTATNDVEAVYGFGSFFRANVYSDIDLLVVATDECTDHLTTYYQIRGHAEEVGRRLGIPIDITFLTAIEFQSRPLLEMDMLVALFKKGVR